MEVVMIGTRSVAALTGLLLLVLPARAEVLRIAMTASDIPTTTGMPNNGFEGMRFLGYPIFEGLVLWDLSRASLACGPASPRATNRLPTTRRPGSSISAAA
jgi:peptide/nickel transport system substrate-binding protein